MTTVFEWEQPPVERRAAFQHNLLVFGEEFASASANEGPQGGLSAFAKGILLQTCPDGEVGNEVKLKDWKRDALGQQASMAGWGTSNNEPLPTLSMGSPGYVQAMTVREVSLLSIDEAEALLKEVRKRGMSSEGYSDAVASKEAEAKVGGLLSGGTGFMAGILVGGVGGAVATATHYRKKITDMEERFGAMEVSLAETEKTLKKEAEKREKEAEERAKEKRAETAVKAFDNRLNLDASFLSNFNGNNGPKY